MRTRVIIRGIKRVFSGAVLIAFLAGLAYLAVWLDPNEPALNGVARASDGDTLRLAGERVRLLGIDAPERDQLCWDAAGARWPCGIRSYNRLAALLREGRTTCRGNTHDRYGRRLAVCSVEGRDLSSVLVREGLALADGRYQSEEVMARSDGAGIWSGRFDTPRAWRDGDRSEPGDGTWFDWIVGLITH